MFGALLHWMPTREEYRALTLLELGELRKVCDEMTKGNRRR